MNVPERRKYLRIMTKKPVLHTRFTLFGVDLSKAIESSSKNLSAGGILFESDLPYSAGDLVRIEIDIPGWEKYKTEFLKPGQNSKSQPITVLAKVIDSVTKTGSIYDIRAAFVGIDEDHQKALSKYIKENLH